MFESGTEFGNREKRLTWLPGKGVDNKDQAASIAGGIAAAHYIRSVAPAYGVPVVLHTGMIPCSTSEITPNFQFEIHFVSLIWIWMLRYPINLCISELMVDEIDHCAKKLLPWCVSSFRKTSQLWTDLELSPDRLDGLLDADEAYFKQHGEPLFSSHMIDLSEEPVDYNIKTTAAYLKRAAPMKQWLEMEIGMF